MNKKHITLFIVALLFGLSMNGANDRNYIYVMDCTGSMITDYKCWNNAKAFLKNQLSYLDTSDRFTIIPFQDHPHPVITGNGGKGNYNWDMIDANLERIISSPHRKTGICEAWIKSMSYLNDSKDNYVILLTDGQEQYQPNNLCPSLERWGNRPMRDHAFYVMLTGQATKIQNELGNRKPENFHFIPANGKIPEFTAPVNPKSIDSYRFSQPIKLPINFTTSRSYGGVKINCSDPHFKVKLDGSKIENGSIRLVISSKYKSVAGLNSKIGKAHNIIVTFKSNNVQFTNPLKITVCNKPERVLSSPAFDESKPFLGTASCYDKFLFWGESHPEALTYQITPQWSNQAKNANSNVTFKVVDEKGRNDFDIKINGKPVNGRQFSLNANSKSAVKLGILFHRDAKEGKREIVIKTVNSFNLERIQETAPANHFTYPMKVKFSKSWNPLKTIAMWIGIAILAALVLWFMVLRWAIYDYCRVGSMRISEPYFSQRRIRGARKIIFTNTPQKQGMINKLFTGAVIYEVNPVWTTPLVFESASGQVKLCSNPNYTIDPFVFRLNKQEEYTITNESTKEKIIITIY